MTLLCKLPGEPPGAFCVGTRRPARGAMSGGPGGVETVGSGGGSDGAVQQTRMVRAAKKSAGRVPGVTASPAPDGGAMPSSLAEVAGDGDAGTGGLDFFGERKTFWIEIFFFMRPRRPPRPPPRTTGYLTGTHAALAGVPRPRCRIPLCCTAPSEECCSADPL